MTSVRSRYQLKDFGDGCEKYMNN
ncbi:YvbH-like oligomerization domain-containing protein [Bacillus spizizenii]|nr:YvbH-like oligomerization domain-containing protein [Bacillus sp. C28GYM-DRY-1]MDO3659684.1 hypothetical protein [Bacillus sp. C28GYM-DRY-1]